MGSFDRRRSNYGGTTKAFCGHRRSWRRDLILDRGLQLLLLLQMILMLLLWVLRHLSVNERGDRKRVWRRCRGDEILLLLLLIYAGRHNKDWMNRFKCRRLRSIVIFSKSVRLELLLLLLMLKNLLVVRKVVYAFDAWVGGLYVTNTGGGMRGRREVCSAATGAWHRWRRN
jgi:hypothetical protein